MKQISCREFRLKFAAYEREELELTDRNGTVGWYRPARGNVNNGKGEVEAKVNANVNEEEIVNRGKDERSKIFEKLKKEYDIREAGGEESRELEHEIEEEPEVCAKCGREGNIVGEYSGWEEGEEYVRVPICKACNGAGKNPNVKYRTI